MRVNLGVYLAGALLVVTPVMAGNITAANNQVTWQSTQCTAPAEYAPIATPPSRHKTAEEANKRVTAYNDYVTQAQVYLDCVSKEAQTDATNVSQSITNSAQKTIDDERKKVADLADTLPQKKQ